MTEDISRRTVLVLVVLTLVVSILSLFAVVGTINEQQNYSYVPTPDATNTNIGTGKVHLSIHQPMEPVSTTGHVTLNVI